MLKAFTNCPVIVIDLNVAKMEPLISGANILNCVKSGPPVSCTVKRGLILRQL